MCLSNTTDRILGFVRGRQSVRVLRRERPCLQYRPDVFCHRQLAPGGRRLTKWIEYCPLVEIPMGRPDAEDFPWAHPARYFGGAPIYRVRSRLSRLETPAMAVF